MREPRPRLLLCLLTAALLGAAVAPALADPSTINPGGTRFRDGHPQNRIRRGEDHPKLQGAPPRTFRHDGRRGHGRSQGHHFKRFKGHNVIVLPSPVVVFPGRCWTDGYWAYQWVPQASPYHVWVPGQWSAAGTWVPGHYQTHYQSSGYYQPYWVAGYWSGC